MANFSGVLRLLLVDNSLTDADRTENHLRAAGYAIRVTRLDEILSIKKALNTQTWDLILCSNRENNIPSQDVKALAQQFHVDSPIIILTFEDDDIDGLYKLNVQDIIPFDDVKRMQFSVARELRYLVGIRKAKQTERVLRESENRAQLLLDLAQNAVAYIHEGIHLDVNRAYLKLFAFEDLEEATGLTLLDLISVRDHRNFKTLLREFTHNVEKETASIIVNCVANDERKFEAEIVFNHAEFDDEDCIQINVTDLTAAKVVATTSDMLVEEALKLDPIDSLVEDLEPLELPTIKIEPLELGDELGGAAEESAFTIQMVKPEIVTESKVNKVAGKQALQAALDEDDFELYYQPIVNMQGDDNEFYDVILRTKSGTLIDDVVHYDANYSLIAELDKWVLRHAVGQLAQYRKIRPNTKFFIRLSRYSLLRDNLKPWLRTLLQAHGLELNNIIIKINEKTVALNTAEITAVVAELAKSACDVSIDYRGKGQDFAQNFAQMQATYLKITDNVITEMLTDIKVQKKVKAILAVAKEQSKQSIAESTSDANGYALLWQLGVDYVQGSYIHDATTEPDFDFSTEEDGEGF